MIATIEVHQFKATLTTSTGKDITLRFEEASEARGAMLQLFDQCKSMGAAVANVVDCRPEAEAVRSMLRNQAKLLGVQGAAFLGDRELEAIGPANMN